MGNSGFDKRESMRFFYSTERPYGPHNLLVKGYRMLLSGIKRQKLEAGRSHPSNAEVTNNGSCVCITSLPKTFLSDVSDCGKIRSACWQHEVQ
jgi:hypothetical protein